MQSGSKCPPTKDPERTRSAEFILRAKITFIRNSKPYLGEIENDPKFLKIYQAYRKAGFRLYPDKHPEKEEMYKQLTSNWITFKNDISLHFNIKAGTEEDFKRLDEFLEGV